MYNKTVLEEAPLDAYYVFKTETGKGIPIDVSAIFLFNLFGIFICICFTCIDIVFHRNIQFTGFFAVGIARKYVNFSVADGGYRRNGILW